MELGNWILIAAVVISLVLGVTNIIQTRKIQDKQFKHTKELRAEEYKSKVLKEIRQWAVEVLNCNFGGKISLTPGISETVQKQAVSANRLLKCQELSVQGKEYIVSIAYSLKYGLDNYVEQVISSINDVRDIIIEYGKNIDNPKRKERLDKVERELQHLIMGLINLTAEYEVMNVVES